jgi:hypothetical protein
MYKIIKLILLIIIVILIITDYFVLIKALDTYDKRDFFNLLIMGCNTLSFILIYLTHLNMEFKNGKH